LRILDGVYHSQDEMDFPCKFKVAADEEQRKKLEREKDNLELIRRRDPHQESRKFIVGWLFPSQLMSEDQIYFLNQSGDQLFPFSSTSPTRIPIQGLVLESGGKNLREFLKNQTLSSVPMTQRIHILEQIVEAVRFLHRLNFVHFDLKPENIVCFTSSGDKMRWKLIDFDSSYDEKLTPSSTSPSVISSPGLLMNLWLTEEFVCPEITRIILQRTQDNILPPDVNINWRMDIWSLGMVAFFLFTNHSLWSAHSASSFTCSMLSNLRQEDIQLILSRALRHKEKSFVESCLQMDPLDRSSATELLGKSLFSTNESTVHANTLKLTNDSMMARFDEMKRLFQESHGLVTEELTEKFADFHLCLTTQVERIHQLNQEELQNLRNCLSSSSQLKEK
jgi:serine/threonine protein kinase